ncbi:hypothetical protein C6P40_003004 [Pichia californica]|uniref:RRM domain-containing protein n=1 Tax=Pichia californica TaxID=460514 RepID=A0A9P6WNW5_9ASCO|nr:hypothetical protein C6P42_003612 [[Candida] californica]KAG0690401.1 hypothetical protein C6P40_003004 [[Candida] californica]
MTDKHTIYIRNLNEKISISKLKLELKSLFEDSGFKVHTIQAYGNLKLKGQAFVSFNKDVDINSVIDIFNTKMMYGKPMNVKIANSESDVIVKDSVDSVNYQQYLKTQQKARLLKKQKLIQTNNKRKRDDELDKESNEIEDEKLNKKIKTSNKVVPNHILIITGLPKNAVEQDFNEIFTKFSGFLTINLVIVRQLALVEFKNESDAVECVNKLGNTIKIREKDCSINYAKK